MPRWLLETFAQIAIYTVAGLAALTVTLAYALTWFANGGATVSDPFNPVAQLIATALWFVLLVAIWFGTRKLLALLA